MKTAIVCLGLLALVGSSTASLDAFKSVKESQELEHTGGEHSKSACSCMASSTGSIVDLGLSAEDQFPWWAS